ncbi:hypothetical protein T492DRAFT_1066762 [Pavlovales sp. CCMP2436]|nr:hypothetical protein T492DRAFT_1066762 [Pavlovales sp. CCMP2436]|mmetsp:Transcript_12255/g.30889  ORF Transcript_12255/g.30889 Transcript_12255/m.30889 type:complete len:120 (+) Transcript_12255:124-483(+)
MASAASDAAGALLARDAATTAKAATRKQALALKSWITNGPLALKVVCFLACAATCAISVLSLLGSLLDPPAFVISAYTALLALTDVLLEMQPLLCTRGCKRRIEFWAKAADRLWGRAAL